MGDHPKRRRQPRIDRVEAPAVLASPISRALVTLLAPVVVLSLRALPCAGLDLTALPWGLGVGGFGFSMLSPGAIGILPLISASVVVELAAAIVPAWRPLRETREGRVRLAFATALLGMTLAAFQIHGLVQVLINEGGAGQASAIVVSPGLVMCSMMGGFALTTWVVSLVTTRGAFNGLVAVWLSGALAQVLASERLPNGDPPLLEHRLIEGALVLLLAVAAGVVMSSSTTGRKNGAEAPGVAIPSPACGWVAYFVAIGILANPYARTWFRLPDEAPYWVSAALAAMLAAVLAWLFHQPEALGKAWRCSVDVVNPALTHAMGIAVAFTLLIVGMGWIAAQAGVQTHHAEAVLLAAVWLDARGAWRAGTATVHVETYQRPHEAEAARTRLAHAGLRCAALDLQQRVLFQVFGPLIPIRLVVHADDEERARAVLTDPETTLAPRATRWAAPVMSCAVALALAFGLQHGFAIGQAPPVAVTPGVLELVLVDGESPWLEGHDRDTPDTVVLLVENAPVGGERPVPRSFARVAGATIPDEVVRWAEKLAPPNRRVAWGRVYEHDDENGTAEMIGWRSYLLHTTTIIDGTDVQTAVAGSERTLTGESWFVTIAFTPEANVKFADATTRHVHRRIAIVLDGIVQSAPEIREPIHGGTARITMGAGDSETQRADAKALAVSLEASRSPSP